MAHDEYENLYPALDLKVRDQEKCWVSVDTNPSRDVILRIHLNAKSGFWDGVASAEMTPEDAIRYAEKIIEIAREVIVRKVLRD